MMTKIVIIIKTNTARFNHHKLQTYSKRLIKNDLLIILMELLFYQEIL